MGHELWLFLAGVLAYVVLVFWLPSVAKKDMDRRGEPGWAYDLAVWWYLPVGLLAWWAARRRYPIIDSKQKPQKSDPTS